MTKWRLLALLFAGLSTPLAAQDAPSNSPADVVVRQSVVPAAGVVIGQHVALLVDVLFRGEMPRPPRVSAPDVSGSQVLQFESQGTTIRETIAGDSYVGQRFEFALYARRGGAFDIPPVSVTLLDSKGGVTGTAQGESVRFEARVPPGVDPSGPVVATGSLTLSEQWAPEPTGPFRAGDAIVRTIARTAEDVPGLAMRDLAFSAPEGVRVYEDPPDIADRSNRGMVTGRRVDRVTYLFERGGRFTLPPASQPWWDLAGGALKTAKAASVTVDVAPAPAEASGPSRPGRLAVATAVVAALLGIVALGAGHILRRRREGPALAERKAFEALRRAGTVADAGALYRAFSDWRLLLAPSNRARATLAASSLDSALFAEGAPVWSRAESCDLVARLALLRRSCPADGHPSALPPLNP